MTSDDQPAGQRNGHKTTRVTNGVVALGSAAVFAVYALGYARTKAASERFADDDAPRRRPAPVPAEAPAPTMSLPPLAETAAPAPTATVQTSATDVPVGRPAAPGDVARTPKPPAADRETSPTAGVSATASTGMTAPAPSSAPATPTTAAVTALPTTAAPAAATAAPVPEPAVAPVAAATATPAPAALAAAVTAAVTEPGKVVLKDGSYTGWGTCRHGDIQATVVVAAGRIQSATISQCWTRYPCSWISPLPPQVVQRQSAEVDYVSGATQSTNAFYDAVMDALAKAK